MGSTQCDLELSALATKLYDAFDRSVVSLSTDEERSRGSDNVPGIDCI